MCGRDLGTELSSTIGDQRALNPALQPMSKERFVELVTTGQPDAPAYFGFDAMSNRQNRPTLEESLAGVGPLSLAEVLALVDEGAQVVETTERLDDLLRDRPLALVCTSGYRSSLGASLLRRHGVPDVRDVQGGMEGWSAAGLPETAAPSATATAGAVGR